MALAVAAGRTRKLKLGTSVLVLPGRNPVVLAKELASLDRLSGGRLLPAVGLGAPVPAEHRAFGVDRRAAGPLFDEALPLIRRLWTEDDVHHDGEHFHVDGVTLRPRPACSTRSTCGSAGARRPSCAGPAGFGDGWLPSFTTPAVAAAGWDVVNERRRRARAGRSTRALRRARPLPGGERARRPRRRGRRRPRPMSTPPTWSPAGLDGAAPAADRAFIEVGASKFVAVPVVEPADWHAELGELAAAVLPLEN